MSLCIKNENFILAYPLVKQSDLKFSDQML